MKRNIRKNDVMSITPIALMLFGLMIITTIFLQLAVEIHAYSFIAKHNIQIGNIKIIQHKLNYRKQKIAEEEIKKASSTAILFIRPVDNCVTSSRFGDTDERNSPHQGHDWAVTAGSEVKASANGVVELAYYSKSYGYNILINHQDGMQTRYAHMSQLYVVPGQSVKQGEIIGVSGSTGDSTGPHLHFEVIKDGVRVNPLGYVSE